VVHCWERNVLAGKERSAGHDRDAGLRAAGKVVCVQADLWIGEQKQLDALVGNRPIGSLLAGHSRPTLVSNKSASLIATGLFQLF
jgi:hypothetical protein